MSVVATWLSSNHATFAPLSKGRVPLGLVRAPILPSNTPSRLRKTFAGLLP